MSLAADRLRDLGDFHMTRSEMEALEFWQTSCQGVVERKLNDLTNTVDDLTTLAHNRAGVRELMAGRKTLLDSLRKLHDLVMETAPAQAAE